MVEFGQYPLVYQLLNGVPVGIAEASSIIVSSVSANTYQGLTGTISFTGVIQIGDATSVGTSLIDNDNPNYPLIKPLAANTDDFVGFTSPPGEGTVTIGWGSSPLSVSRGGTNANTQVAARANLGLTIGTHVQAQNTNLQALADLPGGLVDKKILVGGTSNSLTSIDAPTTDNTFLKYTTAGGFSWAAGGSVSYPNFPGRIPYISDSTTLASQPWLNIETGTGRFNVCEVYGSVSIIVGNTDTTVTRSSAGNIAVQGNLVYRAGGTTIPVADGGTGKSTFNTDQVIFSNDFSQDATFTFDKANKILKSTTVCATTVCATTFQEGGQSLSTKYQGSDSFLTTLATNDTVRLNADVCNTLPVANGGTGKVSYTGNAILYSNSDGNAINELSPPGSPSYLKWNGSVYAWDNPTGTGGGSPGGESNNVQINYAGSFSGNDGLKYNLNTSTLTGSTFSATVVSAGTLHVGGSDGYIVNRNGAIWISATDTVRVIPSLSATSWLGLPSGLDASSLKGYPIVSGYDSGLNPSYGNALMFMTGGGGDGWYYRTPPSLPGGQDTQIQFNYLGNTLSGEPSLNWNYNNKQLSATNIRSDSLSAISLSANAVYPFSTPRRNFIYYGNPLSVSQGQMTVASSLWFSANANIDGTTSATLFTQRIAVAGARSGTTGAAGTSLIFGRYVANPAVGPSIDPTTEDPPTFIAATGTVNGLLFINASGGMQSTDNAFLTTVNNFNDTLNLYRLSATENIYAETLNVIDAVVANGIESGSISATNYYNLPNVSALNGTGVFEVTSYSRNNFVLTGTNLALSNTVSNHIASAVHWELSTLNNNYINASGDSANASFFLQNLSATTFSATNYLNLPSATVTWLNATNAERVRKYVKNMTGATIPKGRPVTITGATGNNALITPLSSINTHVPEAIGLSNHVFGLTETEIANDSFGYILTEGMLSGTGGGVDAVDTAAFAAGDILYVSSNGLLSNSRPPAPYEAHPVGYVVRSHANVGSIYVKIETVPEINDIVGFNLASNLVNGDLITYDLTTSTFVNRQSIDVSGLIKGGSLSATNLSATNARITSLSATTVSATTYRNLPQTDASSIAGTPVSIVTFPIDDNSILTWSTGNNAWEPGSTARLFSVSSTNLSATNARITSLSATTVSATTYLNLPSGTAIWNANKIQSVSVCATAPSRDNQLLAYDLVANSWKAGLAVSSGSGAPTGGVDGDIYIQYFDSVDIPSDASSLRGYQITSTAPVNNNILRYNGTAWVPSASAVLQSVSAASYLNYPVTQAAGTVTGAIQFNSGTNGFDADDLFYYSAKNLYIQQGSGGQLNTDTVVATDVQATQMSVDTVSLTSPAAGALLVNSSLRSPTVSATTYLNLPSGVATWNASALRGFTVSSTTPTNNRVLTYVSAASAWNPQPLPAEIGVACSDETTNLTSGTAKATFRMPYAMTLTSVRANVNTAPSGSTILVDVNKNGSTIFSTRVSIDASEKTSVTAASAFVLSTTSLADDDEITVDIDQVGSSTAGKGLKIWLIGTRA